jgi:hypothetical protein
VSPLDPRTLGTDTPTTLDGRTYPEHLRAYERFDDQILPVVPDGTFTFDDLSMRVDDPKALAMLPRWIASASWRGLIERTDPPSRGPWTYVRGPQAKPRLPHAA